MKKIITAILLVFLCVNIANANDKDGLNVVQKVSDDALTFLDKQEETGFNDEEIKIKFEELLDNYFNVDYIAKSTLGKYWRKATKEEQKEYLGLFKQNLVSLYSNNFKEYSGQKIEIIRSSQRTKTDVIVFSKIISPNTSQPPIEVDWRVKKFRNGEYKIVDLVVAGISMLITQRNEYSSVINQNNGKISALIERLKKN